MQTEEIYIHRDPHTNTSVNKHYLSLFFPNHFNWNCKNAQKCIFFQKGITTTKEKMVSVIKYVGNPSAKKTCQCIKHHKFEVKVLSTLSKHWLVE